LQFQVGFKIERLLDILIVEEPSLSSAVWKLERVFIAVTREQKKRGV